VRQGVTGRYNPDPSDSRQTKPSLPPFQSLPRLGDGGNVDVTQRVAVVEVDLVKFLRGRAGGGGGGREGGRGK